MYCDAARLTTNHRRPYPSTATHTSYHVNVSADLIFDESRSTD